jgi:release factor glutamine methyltransferase
MPEANKTVAEIIQAGTTFLEKHSIETPRLVCELLTSRLLQCKRLELYLQFDRALSESQLAAMRRGIKRAVAGEPVQYILGEWDFMGHVLRVDKRALIPRPETEGLVQKVLDCTDLWADDNPIIADIGTGSGCIAISLALAHENAAFVALDISTDALELARENAAQHQVSDRIHFSEGELADVIEPESLSAIVANLPYITTAEMKGLSTQVRDHEPHLALHGGEDGLDMIRLLVQDATMALKPGGTLFLEIGAAQGEATRALLDADGFTEVNVSQDLAGRDRVVSGRLPVV